MMTTVRFGLVCVLITICLVLNGVNGAGGSCGAGVTWNFDEDTHVLTVSGNGNMDNYNRDQNLPPWDDMKDSIESVVVEDGVNTIGTCAFTSCKSIKSVTFPSVMTSIGNFSFEDCDGLEELVISGTINTIGSSAFQFCSYLRSVTISGSVDNIDTMAFFKGPSLKSVSMTGTVKRIGYGAFQEDALTTLVLSDSLEYIGAAAFEASSLKSATIPASVKEVGHSCFASSELTEIIVQQGNKNYESVDGVLFDSRTKTLVQFPAGKDATTYSIPDKTVVVGEFAFSGAKKVKTVVFPDSVTTIGSHAFESSTLVETIIPEGVTVINDCVFQYCRSLEKVIIPDGVSSIGDSSFFGCWNLKSVVLPLHLTTIGPNAFQQCSSIRTVTIPDAVTTIRYDAFRECKSLLYIFYQGTHYIAPTPFSYCESISAVCVSPYYKNDTFAGLTVTSSSSFCEEFQKHFNGCYAPYYDYDDNQFILKGRMLSAAIWENDTNACGVHQCTNESGFISWSLCNSSDDTSSICMESGCVEKWEENTKDHMWWTEIVFEGLKFSGLALDDLFSDLERAGVGFEVSNVGIETNEKGYVTRCIIFDMGDYSCQQLNAIDRIDCSYRVLCKMKNAIYHDAMSGANSIHGVKGMLAMFITLGIMLSFY